MFVTWRLAGTLPHAAPQSWMDSDAQLDRAASGPRWLAQPDLARMVAEALRYGETLRNWYCRHAGVVMPNHVPAVMTPQHAFSEIMRWLRGPRRGVPISAWDGPGSPSGRMSLTTIGFETSMTLRESWGM